MRSHQEQANAYHVMVSSKLDGARVTPVLDRILVELLTRSTFDQFGQIRELDGFRPAYVDLRAIPRPRSSSRRAP